MDPVKQLQEVARGAKEVADGRKEEIAELKEIDKRYENLQKKYAEMTRDLKQNNADYDALADKISRQTGETITRSGETKPTEGERDGGSSSGN